jgi:hypothetical protein
MAERRGLQTPAHASSECASSTIAASHEPCLHITRQRTRLRDDRLRVGKTARRARRAWCASVSTALAKTARFAPRMDPLDRTRSERRSRARKSYWRIVPIVRKQCVERAAHVPVKPTRELRQVVVARRDDEVLVVDHQIPMAGRPRPSVAARPRARTASTAAPTGPTDSEAPYVRSSGA